MIHATTANAMNLVMTSTADANEVMPLIRAAIGSPDLVVGRQFVFMPANRTDGFLLLEHEDKYSNAVRFPAP
jgi:hypothetical protein